MQMSLTDPLTGLRNRRYLRLHLEADVAAALRRSSDGSALGFFLIDIDHFKAVNDEHGHRAATQC
jgi:diguanylate cyclase (GGDEF)-like protein